jgi:hypothetical protein
MRIKPTLKEAKEVCKIMNNLRDKIYDILITIAKIIQKN